MINIENSLMLGVLLFGGEMVLQIAIDESNVLLPMMFSPAEKLPRMHYDFNNCQTGKIHVTI